MVIGELCSDSPSMQPGAPLRSVAWCVLILRNAEAALSAVLPAQPAGLIGTGVLCARAGCEPFFTKKLKRNLENTDETPSRCAKKHSGVHCSENVNSLVFH